MMEIRHPAGYDHHSGIQDFHQWMTDSVVEGVQGAGKASFLPISALIARFETRYLGKLKKWVYGSSSSNFHVKSIRDQGYCKVFCILLEIGKGEYIDYFLQHPSLCDSKLPFAPESLPPKFPVQADDPNFFAKFCDKQWLLCAPEFRNTLKSSYRKEEVLPIIEKTYITQGGSAQIYRIKLHEAYDKFDKPSKTYILKQYHHTENAEKDYNAEVQAFGILGSVEGLIGFKMGYEQGNTYNVILEDADKGTLEDYFKNTEPPSTSIDIHNFWKGILNLLPAVMKIHAVPFKEEDGQEALQGLHQDINPLNIVIKSNGEDGKDSPYEYQFKLADLGLSHFKSKAVSRREITDIDTYGTLTYGAPETYRANSSFDNTRLHVSSAVDIWSICAVLSEACVWVAHGMPGLERYRHRRWLATEKIPNFRAGNCFHDGHNVLEVVKTMHDEIKGTLRLSDEVTDQVWLGMIKDGLTSDADERLSALQLWKKSIKLLDIVDSKLHSRPSLEWRNFRPSVDGSGTPIRRHDWPTGKSIQSRDSRSDDLPPNAIRSSSNPLMQLTDGAQPGFRPIPNGFKVFVSIPNGFEEMGDKHVLGQGFPQEQPNLKESSHLDSPNTLTADDNICSSSSKHASKTIGYVERYSPDNMNTRSRGSSYSQSPNTKGSNTPVGVVTLPADDAITNRRVGEACPYAPHSNTLSGPPQLAGAHNKPSDSLGNGQYKYPFDEAKKWRDKPKASRNRKFSIRETQLIAFRKQFGGRDIVFLIDDSASMLPHWEEVQESFRVLAYIAKSFGDEIELRFTSSTECWKNKKTTLLLDLIRNKKPAGLSDMKEPFDQILDGYRTRQQDNDDRPKNRFWPAKSPRRLSLYVFTNGTWEDNIGVEKPIENMVKFLEERSKTARTVGIQFIRFGDDPEGIKRLNHLDRLPLSMDIVDTEPSNGNVWKIILGSINKHFDNDPVGHHMANKSPSGESKS